MASWIIRGDSLIRLCIARADVPVESAADAQLALVCSAGERAVGARFRRSLVRPLPRRMTIEECGSCLCGRSRYLAPASWRYWP
jgi:hypothetical protein